MTDRLKSGRAPKRAKPRLSRENLPSDWPEVWPKEDLNLHFVSAASEGKTKEINHLLALGADINMCDLLGWTPLHYAAKAKQAKTCAFLVANGAIATNKSLTGTTPLMLAFQNESKPAILAIEAGVMVPLVGLGRSKEFVFYFNKCISRGD